MKEASAVERVVMEIKDQLEEMLKAQSKVYLLTEVVAFCEIELEKLNLNLVTVAGVTLGLPKSQTIQQGE